MIPLLLEHGRDGTGIAGGAGGAGTQIGRVEGSMHSSDDAFARQYILNELVSRSRNWQASGSMNIANANAKAKASDDEKNKKVADATMDATSGGTGYGSAGAIGGSLETGGPSSGTPWLLGLPALYDTCGVSGPLTGPLTDPLTGPITGLEAAQAATGASSASPIGQNVNPEMPVSANQQPTPDQAVQAGGAGEAAGQAQQRHQIVYVQVSRLLSLL